MEVKIEDRHHATAATLVSNARKPGERPYIDFDELERSIVAALAVERAAGYAEGQREAGELFNAASALSELQERALRLTVDALASYPKDRWMQDRIEALRRLFPSAFASAMPEAEREPESAAVSVKPKMHTPEWLGPPTDDDEPAPVQPASEPVPHEQYQQGWMVGFNEGINFDERPTGAVPVEADERADWLAYAALLCEEINAHLGMSIAHGYTGNLERHARGIALRARLGISDTHEDLRGGR